jgi:dTDP-4-amino-4,6-dideoxygalactose transaminase
MIPATLSSNYDDAIAMKIPFFRNTITGNELSNITQVINESGAFSTKKFALKCEQWFTQNHGVKNMFLTKSCTASLELAVMVIDIKPGDEVIMPSFAFVSCANAVALRGGTCVFVDIHPENLTLDETKIEVAITPKTKAILTLNYAGSACAYERITEIAKKHKLFIIEDNAHGIGARYRGQYLGTFGDISTFSFDHMKNIGCGQGGGIAINNDKLLDKFFVSYEYGTNRRAFFRGETEKYEWQGIGSNYILPELNAAMLYTQLEQLEIVNGSFRNQWNLYRELLDRLKQDGIIELPTPLSGIEHNAHCFYIKTRNLMERNELIKHLEQSQIYAQSHFTALHTSHFGKTAGRFVGPDNFTTNDSERLLRLPLYYGISDEDVKRVSDQIYRFYNSNSPAT